MGVGVVGGRSETMAEMRINDMDAYSQLVKRAQAVGGVGDGLSFVFFRLVWGGACGFLAGFSGVLIWIWCSDLDLDFFAFGLFCIWTWTWGLGLGLLGIGIGFGFGFGFGSIIN